ncbi:MAG TPA: TolC family protein [Polyangiales bacterium]|nr:TolC family protein [Polyangiales bacterium]
MRLQLFTLFVLVTVVAAQSSAARAQQPAALPEPLRLEDVLVYARAHRQEIAAARAEVHAGEQRPAIVSGLEDPMLMPSIDHLPFMLHGVDASLMIEQRFPLSGVLGQRKRAAEAEVRRLRARSETVEQDVLLDAARAFLMLRERRDTAQVLETQRSLAREFVEAANARYSAGTTSQPDVLRAEVELARLNGVLRAMGAEIAAAESMLNASLGRPVDARVPALAGAPLDAAPASWSEVRKTTLHGRSELQEGRAEIARAEAEIGTMEAMYAPMGLVRTGPAYTMSDGWGVMLTLGISIPIWSGKYEAGIREARAMASMARADVAAMTRMVEGEAASARHQVVAARERVLSLRDDVLPRARSAIAPSVSAYAAGNAPLVSVIDAAQSLWSLEAELVAAEFELGLAWARLHRALGNLDTGVRR